MYGSKSTPILTGTITDAKNGMQDTIIFTVQDDKYLLDKITCFGQIQFDPSVGDKGGKKSFVASEPLVFNMFGYANCIDVTKIDGEGNRVATGEVAFAPTIRWGWKAGQTEEPEPGQAFDRARSFRCSDVASYLRSAHYDNPIRRPGNGNVNGVYYGDPYVDSTEIIWP